MITKDEVPVTFNWAWVAIIILAFVSTWLLCDLAYRALQTQRVPCAGYKFIERPSERVFICHNGELNKTHIKVTK
jgi:hypothetical protein